MRWCRGDIRRQIEFFDPSVTFLPKALINPPFRGGSCPKSVTHVSLLICHPCPTTIPSAPNSPNHCFSTAAGCEYDAFAGWVSSVTFPDEDRLSRLMISFEVATPSNMW